MAGQHTVISLCRGFVTTDLSCISLRGRIGTEVGCAGRKNGLIKNPQFTSHGNHLCALVVGSWITKMAGLGANQLKLGDGG